MKVEQWSTTADERSFTSFRDGQEIQLVLVFGGREALANDAVWPALRQTFPVACVLGCSTAGEIVGTQVRDDSLAVTAVQFEHSHLKSGTLHLQDGESSYDAGKRLANTISHDGLQHAFVLSDGLLVNGSELVRGMTDTLPNDVTLTGGLSADGPRFEQTLVMCDNEPSSGKLAILGLYGSQLRVGFGSLGGWDAFGPLRLVTRSQDNVLHELDGKPALELYKSYLGEQANQLPASALLYPLAVRETPDADPVVRTILGVQDDPPSMVFAGDIPEGWYAQLMKANFDRLIDGASGAAQRSLFHDAGQNATLALLISCVGRKLVLKQRVEEEVEAVRDVLGDDAVLTGFYSYGEISPFTPSAKCELHNQTMTITTLAETSGG